MEMRFARRELSNAHLRIEQVTYAGLRSTDLVIDLSIATLSKPEQTFLYQLLTIIGFFETSPSADLPLQSGKAVDVLTIQGPTYGTRKRFYDADDHPRELDVLVSWLRMLEVQ